MLCNVNICDIMNPNQILFTDERKDTMPASLKNFIRNDFSIIFFGVVGSLIFTIGFVLFIQPANLYSGGFLGIAQLVTIPFKPLFGMQVNIEGILYFLFNVPIFIIALKTLGLKYVCYAATALISESLFLTFFPVLQAPLVNDVLVNCIIGGIIEGLGTVIAYIGFSSAGGTDMLDILLCRRFRGLGSGIVPLLINLAVYAVCAFMFSIETAIYSFIVSVCSSVVVNKLHLQNTCVQVNIVSKKYPEIEDYLVNVIGRDATVSTCIGSYSHEERHIVLSIMSKYELQLAKREIKKIDPNAFIFINDDVSVIGEFEKRLSKN